MGKALGIISLIFGLIGLTVGWTIGMLLPLGSFYLPVTALVCGIVGVCVQEKKGMAIAGLVLGAVGIVLAIFVFPILIYLIQYFLYGYPIFLY